ncbi:hypothetical protein BDC45DRAFT_602828 [Circinella umbellata]|nr:hypothetical protein BDC45DRAFT_602828 [Circinella umbellata]
MSRIPDSPTLITTRSNSETIRTMRLARQASHDFLKSRHQYRLPTPVTVSKSTTRMQSSRSRMSDSSGDDEFMDTPIHNSAPRFSISSNTSSIQTTLSTPRSSLPSVHEQQSPANLCVGQRVMVESRKLKGTLRFLGTTHFKPGIWAGIELDQPGSGKNDGSVDSTRYFNCPPKTGIFVLSSKVTCRTQHQQYQHSNPASPSSPNLRKKKALAKQTSLPCINTARQHQQQEHQQLFHQQHQQQYINQHQQRPRHPLSVSPKASGIPSPEMTPTTLHEGLDMSAPVMHQDEDKFHLLSNSTDRVDNRSLSSSSSTVTTASKKEIDLVPATHIRECLHCKEHEHVRTDLETKLLELTAALNSNTEITLSYKCRVKELEQTVEELKRAGMETIELYECTTSKHETSMKRHTAKLAQAHARIQALENERDRLKLSKEDAETVVSEYTQVERPQLIEEHHKKEQQSQKEIKQLQQALEHEKTTHQSIERENDRLREKVSQLENDLETNNATTQTENKQLKQESQAMQEALKQSQLEYQLLQDRIKALPPTPVGLASIPEQQLQVQLNEAKSMLNSMQQERVLESEKYRKHINILNRDISELESLIEAKLFKEVDLLEALDHERRVVRRLLTEHQGSTAGRRRKMTQTTTLTTMSTMPSIRSLASSTSTSTSISTPSSTLTKPPPSLPCRPPPTASVPPIPPTLTSLSRNSNLLQRHLDDETPFCDVCQISGHDLMGCSNLFDQIPTTTTTLSSQFSSSTQPRRTEYKAF